MRNQGFAMYVNIGKEPTMVGKDDALTFVLGAATFNPAKLTPQEWSVVINVATRHLDMRFCKPLQGLKQIFNHENEVVPPTELNLVKAMKSVPYPEIRHNDVFFDCFALNPRPSWNEWPEKNVATEMRLLLSRNKVFYVVSIPWERKEVEKVHRLPSRWYEANKVVFQRYDDVSALTQTLPLTTDGTLTGMRILMSIYSALGSTERDLVRCINSTKETRSCVEGLLKRLGVPL